MPLKLPARPGQEVGMLRLAMEKHEVEYVLYYLLEDPGETVNARTKDVA